MLLDSAMAVFPVYNYCRKQSITLFIDLKIIKNSNYKYKDDFNLDKDGVPICKMVLHTYHDSIEKAKNQATFRVLKRIVNKNVSVKLHVLILSKKNCLYTNTRLPKVN